MPNIPQIHLDLLEIWRRLTTLETKTSSATHITADGSPMDVDYIPVENSILIINYTGTTSFAMPDLQTINIPLGTKFVIVSSPDSNSDPGANFYWSMACDNQSNVIQGYHADPPSTDDKREKLFTPGDIMEVIYIGNGKWRMLSFNTAASCYSPY